MTDRGRHASRICWITNTTILVLGSLTSTLTLAWLSPWPWWVALVLLAPIFIAWHLLVERFISRVVNRIVAGTWNDR